MKKSKHKDKKTAVPSGLKAMKIGGPQDISAGLSAFNRSLILDHCDSGVLRGGKGDGEKFRATSAERTRFHQVSGELYLRSDSIEMDAFGKYYVVYKLNG
jgi:hypothetical protein